MNDSLSNGGKAGQTPLALGVDGRNLRSDWEIQKKKFD